MVKHTSMCLYICMKRNNKQNDREHNLHEHKERNDGRAG